eukprot:TRINITY_DN5003_c0_g1_i1.p1 TRINITY_DN5003_c0_g1~~TRINITY_DN5003_c0_g1_i1.p1  ORF type:complete len:134 (-),score=14.00 TRINITY_DN5003_c0_g1_i1:86-487(-)
MQVQGTPEPTEDKLRGRPKSGRGWKTRTLRSETTRVKPKALKSNQKRVEEQRKEREKHKLIITAINEAQDRKKQEAREERKRRRKIREENLLKSSTYQVITHTEKVKRMSKKQRKQVMPLADLVKLQTKRTQS